MEEKQHVGHSAESRTRWADPSETQFENWYSQNENFIFRVWLPHAVSERGGLDRKASIEAAQSNVAAFQRVVGERAGPSRVRNEES